MSPRAVFTIRETVYYTGTIVIDPEKWESLFAAPFDPEHPYAADLAIYVAKTGAKVEETNASIDGQEWTDIDIEEDE